MPLKLVVVDGLGERKEKLCGRQDGLSAICGCGVTKRVGGARSPKKGDFPNCRKNRRRTGEFTGGISGRRGTSLSDKDGQVRFAGESKLGAGLPGRWQGEGPIASNLYKLKNVI